MILGALLTAACTPSQQGGPEVWRVSPEPELAIGRIMGDDAYLFDSVESARFLPDGRILVADRGKSVLGIYGSDGTLRTRFGGPGEGPGEFLKIDGTWLLPGGRIAVWDARNRRITTFGADGELVATNRVVGGEDRRGTFANLRAFLGVFGNGDAVLAALHLGTEIEGTEVRPDPWILGRYGPGGELRRRLGELRGMRRRARRPIPFSPIPRVAVTEDSIYVADGYGATIRVLDASGDSIRPIELPGREVAPQDPWSALEAELESRSRPGGELLLINLRRERVPLESRFPRIAHLLVDDRGRLWVKTYEVPDDSIWLGSKGALWPSPGGEWRVVRPNGEIVATVRMPETVIPLEIEGDRLLGLSVSELEVERVVVHAIE